MGKQADCLFIVLPELLHPDYGYELGIIWKNESGIHMTGYFCGFDWELAAEYVNELNIERGHTPKFTTMILENYIGISALRFAPV